jgi:TPR repeat protein
MKQLIIFLILVVLSVTNVFAQYNIKQPENGRSQYHKALEYYNNHEYKKAVYWFQESAKQGYADAMFNLAMCYKNNKGIQISSKNDSIAAEWFYKSDKNGNIKAKKELNKLNIEPICNLYDNTIYYPLNVEDEIIVAKYFYNKNDYNRAVYWYKKAAEQEDVEAQYNLGVCYENGYGVTNDYSQAVYWYKKSADQGYADAEKKLRELGQITYNQSNINDSFYKIKKSAEEGDAEAQYKMGDCYYNGGGVIKDYDQAFYWYKKSAEQGYAEAQYNLGLGYYYGVIEQDHSQAVYWFNKAAVQGYAAAQFILGVCYENGYGVEYNYNQAIYWYKKSAEQDYTEAKQRLSELENSKKIEKKHYNISEFNSPKGRIRKYGVSIGYVSKKWMKDGCENERIEDLEGIRWGLRIEPLYKYGFGINRGYFIGLYDIDKMATDSCSISFDMPINIEYRLNFSKDFQLFFYGGLDFELWLGYLIEERKEGSSDLECIDILKEYGIGFRIKALQLDIGISQGLLNVLSSNSNYHLEQQISMSLSIMF